MFLCIASVRLLDTSPLLRYQLTRFNITVIDYQSHNPSWDGPQDVRGLLSESSFKGIAVNCAAALAHSLTNVSGACYQARFT